MPRLTKSTPKYRLHKASGQAVVTLNGRDHYLGKHGTAKSQQRYRELMSDWYANDCQTRNNQSSSPVSVVVLIARYWDHANQYYVKNGEPTGEIGSIRVAMRSLRRHCVELPAEAFGPLWLFET